MPTPEVSADPAKVDFGHFIEQMMDPDGMVFTVGARNDGARILDFLVDNGDVGIQFGWNQQDVFDIQPNLKTTPKFGSEGTRLGGEDNEHAKGLIN